MAPPTTFGVVAEREIYVVKETVPGTVPAGAPGTPVPITTFKPSDKPMLLDDDSWQGSMGDTFAQIQGPLIASEDIGGNIYGDTFPHFLYNILGDYTAVGTAASPASTTNAAMAAGATAIPVASGGTSFTTGMFLWLEDAGTPAANEIVQVTATGSATSIPITATRFAHLTAMPFTNTTGPYVHTFAVLRGSIGAANGPAQPPTHCLTDVNGLTANGAAEYAYGCLSELVITGNSEQLMKWTGKLTSETRQIPGSQVSTTNVSNVQAYPGWRSVVGIGGPASGGTQVKDIGEWSVTIGRALKVYNTDDGSQLPYLIARGKQPNTGQMLITPAIDESALIALLANTQPQLQFVASNGLSGTSLVQVQVDIILGSYQTADIDDSTELFGYTVPFKPIHTAASSGGITTTGASGGKGAVKVTVTNNTPIF